ncbi:MAG: hypothetical protein E6G69_18680, partial [Alphaproteobacteria bacterium]
MGGLADAARFAGRAAARNDADHRILRGAIRGTESLGSAGSDAHIPLYARVPYQPFSREAAIQIAYREWRAFG